MAHVEFNGSDCNKLKGNIGDCMGTVQFFSFHGILVYSVVFECFALPIWAWALDSIALHLHSMPLCGTTSWFGITLDL